MLADSDNETYAYLPVSEIVTRLGLYVTGAGTDRVPPGAPYPRQQHPELYNLIWRTGRVLPEYQFVFVSDGTGEFESRETGRLEVRPGTMMTLFPDVCHRYRPLAETGWTEYWISVGGDLLFHWQRRELLRPDRPLTRLRRPAAAVGKYCSIIELVTKQPGQDGLMLAAQAMTIIALALESAEMSPLRIAAGAEPKPPLDPPVTDALHLIWAHSHRPLSVGAIAKKVGVSRRTLERHFQQQLGHTVLKELLGCRVERARRLLAETHVPIKYVAFAAGFSSPSSFCKVFRREMGHSPGAYRANCLEAAVRTKT